ncbi:glycosyltransferase family 4 protein [Cryobacterium sp. 1639]|uniref:glycosyltransferase family 4 protein n=1 Tax=Cryobacterium inferilacus TaxID=2866629 RepID=UPI001C739AA2|nr:glycosyltransferase family 4 protein [Cryobacterium sp. 1639]MBX0299456.1 glycosyltransferase family 4 protein [Cryobacterium sp. 1639]
MLFGIVTGATGLLPPRIRYGYVHRLTRGVLRTTLPAVRADGPDTATAVATHVTRPGTLSCVLAVDALDTGGIGSVVEVLATRLPARGITPTVVCFGEGIRVQRLRGLGIDVRPVSDLASARAVFDELRPHVIQLHSAPSFLEVAASTSQVPLVVVLHNTEIHFSRARWQRVAELLWRSEFSIAVSDLVRSFHLEHLPGVLHSRVVVVPNAAPGQPAPDQHRRQASREILETALDCRFNDDVIFLCLARYDAQKNIAGTVASFLACVSAGVPAQLVVAGEPSDWVEFHRSDAIRRASRSADRVHFLAASDPPTLLAGADAFLLNSFFEGWPVAATEAWTTGLPLVLSDVGGARELVERDPGRSILISNATGEASGVTDTRVERARRRARHQSNSPELGDAIRSVVGTVRRERVESPASQPAADGVAVMISEHAQVLRDAAQRRPPRGTTRPGRLSDGEMKGTVTT